MTAINVESEREMSETAASDKKAPIDLYFAEVTEDRDRFRWHITDGCMLIARSEISFESNFDAINDLDCVRGAARKGLVGIVLNNNPNVGNYNYIVAGNSIVSYLVFETHPKLYRNEPKGFMVSLNSFVQKVFKTFMLPEEYIEWNMKNIQTKTEEDK